MPEAMVSGHRIAAIALRIITQFRRDRRTLALIFAVPLIVLSLVSYLIDLKPSEIQFGVVNEDQALISVADAIVNLMEENTDLQMVELSQSEAEAQLRNGKIQAALFFPADFTRNLIMAQGPTITLLLEGSDPQVVGYVRDSLEAAIPQALAGIPGMEGRSINIEPRFIYGGQDYSTMDYLGPAFIVLIPFFFVFLLTSISFLRERAQGTIERLLASPLSRAETVIGYMLGFGLFSFVQSLIILLFTVYVLDVHCEGNILTAILIVVIMVLTAVNIGIFVSTFAHNEFQAVQFVPLIIFPQALLGGLFWSIGSLPWFLRWMSYLMPITYANFAVEEVMIKGASALDWSVGSNLLILVAFTLALIVLSAVTLRRQIA